MKINIASPAAYYGLDIFYVTNAACKRRYIRGFSDLIAGNYQLIVFENVIAV